MTAFDLSSMLAPVAPDQPCGADLEYDADFLALVQAATPKPEREMGSEVIPAEEPNWREVKQLATRLLQRSKDLRVAVLLCRALLHADGVGGFADGLQLVRGLLEQYWPGLFPLLDADDADDPTMRVNVLLGLADVGGMLKSLREAPLVVARVAGSFGLREIDAAAGRSSMPGGASPPTPELIRAAFQEVEPQALERTHQQLCAARDELKAIASVLGERLGGLSPDLRPLATMLDGQRRELEAQMQGRGTPVPGAAAGADSAAATAPPTGGQAVAVGAASPAGVHSRSDVLQWIDRICDFYASNEPSSPVPLLLQRARRLVNKSFLDVVRDLVPDGLNQAQLFQGQQEQS